MSKAKAINLLKRLAEAHGCSGSEYPVRKIFETELPVRHERDNNGCLIYTFAGDCKTPKIMLEAHMDEVGFMVQSFTADGLIRFVALGGWWNHLLPAMRVRVLTQSDTEVIGVIASKPTHFQSPDDRERIQKLENMYIDVGANSADELSRDFGVSLGDPIVPDSRFQTMTNPDLLLGKGFDNRAGVALAIQVSQQLNDIRHPNTVFTVGSVQEEVGVRGINSALNVVNPDIAIVLEASPADDFPGSGKDERQCIMGNGVQIRLMDASAIMNRPFTRFAAETAEKCEIPYQVAVRRTGGTDAKAIHLHGVGVPTIVLGVPARYIHTQNSIININDYFHTLKLAVELIKCLDQQTIDGFVL